MLRAVVDTALAALLVLAIAGPVAAANPEFHERFKVDETFQEDICGVPVTTRVQGNVNAKLQGGVFTDNSRIRVTFTDADGDWVTSFRAGRVRVSESWNEDGTVLTVRIVHTGVHQWLRSSEGTLFKDRGRIVFVETIEINDPEDPEDDSFSFEIVFQAGPHPEADSDFTLFCEAFTSVLE